MPGPIRPNQNTTQQDTAGTQHKPQRDTDRGDMSNERPDDEQKRGGSPQDDRDPDSPRRSTQRPGEPTCEDPRRNSDDVDRISDVKP